MHALVWLNEGGRILRGAIPPVECVLFACYRLFYRWSVPSPRSKAFLHTLKKKNAFMKTTCPMIH